MSIIRRNYQRIPLNIPVTIIITDYTLQEAVCKNISMGGMCISVEDSSVEKQENGKVELNYHCEEEIIQFKGEFTIKWLYVGENNHREFGMQFTYYDASNSTNLARIVLNQLNSEKSCTQA